MNAVATPETIAAGASQMPAAAENGRKIGDVVLDIQNISLRFGGVKALTDISFNVKEHEIRSIIGPNGAGKSSMLNVINGVYHPQEGQIFSFISPAHCDSHRPDGPAHGGMHFPDPHCRLPDPFQVLV